MKSTGHAVLKSGNAASLRWKLVDEEFDVKQVLQITEVIEVFCCQVAVQVVCFTVVNKSQAVFGCIFRFFNIDLCQSRQLLLQHS